MHLKKQPINVNESIMKKTIFFTLLLIALISLGCATPKYDNIDSARPTKGPADAKIVVEEYSDFQCPACRSAQPYIKETLKEFGDKIIYKFKHYPLDNTCNKAMEQQLHENACKSAYASECANDQNKFWEMHDKLFESPELSRETLTRLAKELNLDITKFDACIDSKAKDYVIQKDLREGNAKNVDGTPSIFINGEKIDNYIFLKNMVKNQIG